MLLHQDLSWQVHQNPPEPDKYPVLTFSSSFYQNPFFPLHTALTAHTLFFHYGNYCNIPTVSTQQHKKQQYTIEEADLRKIRSLFFFSFCS